ncbi:MAG: hypothetical protein JWP19_2219 [Rhodoglobus sp.]|nr:hypothetical protein [Rhodoglobus sp.]
MTRILTVEEQEYNRDSLLCDQMWAFHQDIFDVLDEKELADVAMYYPQDLDEVPDVFARRTVLVALNPGLDQRARTALAKAVLEIGIPLDQYDDHFPAAGMRPDD